jgi:hypothetical protein
VPPDWMPASGIEPLVLEDPAVVWLRVYGLEHGLQPDDSPYEFPDFIGDKARQFEEAWIENMAPDAIRVCANAYEARSADQVRQTLALMQQGIPVLVQPALWWAPERIYGVPDLLVHTSWLRDQFPRLAESDAESASHVVSPERSEGAERSDAAFGQAELEATAAGRAAVGDAAKAGHYVVFDLKFTSKLDAAHKARDLASYAAQVRIYSYMLGQLQGFMPRRAYLVTRDRIFDPLAVDVTSTLGQPLDEDLAALRDQFIEIKVNGGRYVPWRDAIVASNLSHQDARWQTAKRIIAHEKTPGRDPAIVYRIGAGAKRELARHGFSTLDSLLQADLRTIPLEKCTNVGPATARLIRAILEANRSGSPLVPPSGLVLPAKEFEFYVDFEYFSNVNVDFDRQWPTLDGCEMIFMIGIGWRPGGGWGPGQGGAPGPKEGWAFRTFVAAAESHGQEREMVEEFVDFLQRQTDGAFLDGTRTSIFHWTGAEVMQCLRASERHRLPDDHPVRRLPWLDLHKEFLKAAIGLPGAWSYQLKDVSRAVARLQPPAHADLEWPEDLDQGLRAMVMGWRAYQTSQPLESREMATLRQYLEADCKALEAIVHWMRSRRAG